MKNLFNLFYDNDDDPIEGNQQRQQVIDGLSAAGWVLWSANASPEERQEALDRFERDEPFTLYPLGSGTVMPS